LIVCAVTAFTVTAGVLGGGTGGGSLAGTPGPALTAAATAKLFLFDLATLDRIFRVAAFVVVGRVLLSMGAGYARSLAQQGPW
jgi:uncharacterized membrane protein